MKSVYGKKEGMKKKKGEKTTSAKKYDRKSRNKSKQ